MNEKINTGTKRILFIFGVILVLLTGALFLNRYRVQSIQYEGLTRYTEEEFSSRIQEGFFNAFTPFFCWSDTFFQKEIPFIEKYEIRYSDRQTAKVTVHEKRVIGCVIVMGRYMFFDKDGIVVESSDTLPEGIPVITGLKFNEIVLYKELQVQKQSLFDVILQISRLIEQNSLPIREISFDNNYSVTLHLDNLTVLLGKRTSYDEAMNALKDILVSVAGRSGTLDMQNYTSENGEVILKEQ